MFVKQTIIAVSAIAFGLTVAQPSDARLVRLVVEQRTAFVGGASWGSAGPYELLRGTAFMEVDPRDPRNSLIVDLENAPRNARGMVEFTTQFAIAKPVDMQRSNHKIFHAVNNRGNNLEGLLTSTTQSQIAGTTAGYAFSQGYVVVDAGWEGDLVPAPTRLVANLPRASMPNGPRSSARCDTNTATAPMAASPPIWKVRQGSSRMRHPISTRPMPHLLWPTLRTGRNLDSVKPLGVRHLSHRAGKPRREQRRLVLFQRF